MTRKISFRVRHRMKYRSTRRPWWVQVKEFGKWKWLPGTCFHMEPGAILCRDTLTARFAPEPTPAAEWTVAEGCECDTCTRARRVANDNASSYVMQADDPAVQIGTEEHFAASHLETHDDAIAAGLRDREV